MLSEAKHDNCCRPVMACVLPVVAVLVLSACAASVPTAVSTTPNQEATGAVTSTGVATLTPPPVKEPASPTTPAPSTREGNYRVEIAMFDANGRTAVSAPVGGQVALTIAFRPYKDVITTRPDGTVTKYATNWSTNSIAEMRYCTGQGRSCTLPDRWIPFANEQRVAVPVDWLGTRDYGVTAQFRDASGKTIPAGLNLGESASNWITLTGAVDDRTPVAAQPPAIQTIIAQGRAAFPILGSIKVGTQSMMGGKAGTSVDIPVHFEAAGPAGAVTEMRVKRDMTGRCLTPAEMGDATWEPFVADKVYQTSIALNFSSFKLHVQYRDAKGNLSQVYCGEVTLEGSP